MVLRAFSLILCIYFASASITSELASVLGDEPAQDSLKNVLLSYNSSSSGGEMSSILAKLDEFSKRLQTEDAQHWESTRASLVRDNITVYEKQSEVLMLEMDIEDESAKLERRIKSHDRELALLETIHRHIGTAHASETQGSVEARGRKIVAGAEATTEGRKEGGGFHMDGEEAGGVATQVATFLDKFAKRVLKEETEDRQTFDTFRRETTETIDRLKLEVEQLKEGMTLAQETYQKAKQERDSQIGLVASARKMIEEDAANTDEQRIAEDKARGGSTWWNKHIKEADEEAVRRNNKYVSDNFTPTPTGWRPWTGAPAEDPHIPAPARS